MNSHQLLFSHHNKKKHHIIKKFRLFQSNRNIQKKTPLKWTSFFHDLCFLLDSVFFGNGIESFLDLVFCQSVLFDIKVIRAYTAFVTAATHIFIFVFFGAENLLVTVRVGTVDVAFTWLPVKIVSADND